MSEHLNYVVIKKNSIDKLEKAVSAYIIDGWSLHGYMQIDTDEGMYIQVVTKL
jgi:hypothetical protein